MTLKELAVQYRETSVHIREKIFYYEALLAGNVLSETEKYRINGRLATLWTMFRELRGTAARLEKYYERGTENGRDKG